jgi:hypothetical protein
MPRSKFNNNIITTVVPISHLYLGNDETNYLEKCFTGEVETVQLAFEDQCGRTRHLKCEIAEDVDFLPNENVVLLEDQSKQFHNSELMDYR